jgi:hypothetical protein
MVASWQHYGTYDESAHPDLWDGVVGYWAPCLGPTGLRLHDVSRWNNWGTLINMDAATDWVVSDGRYALDFDGSNDYVRMPRPSQIPQSNADKFTIATWVLLRQGYGKLLDVNSTTGIIVYASTVGNLSGGIQMGVGTTYPITSATQLTANTWTLLTIVFNDKNVQLYFNGRSDGSGTSAQRPDFSTASFDLGGTGGVETANGQIDDFVVWNRDLSAGEVAALHRLGRGGMLQRRPRRRVYTEPAGFRAHYATQRNAQLIGGGLR